MPMPSMPLFLRHAPRLALATACGAGRGIGRIAAAIPTLVALCLPPVRVTLLAVLRGQTGLDLPRAAALIVLQHGSVAQPVAAAVWGLSRRIRVRA